jgi:cytochrome c biogenesis protein CcdA
VFRRCLGSVGYAVSGSLWASVAAIAAVDAFNPSPVLACAYLLSTPKPLRRVSSFVAGAFFTRFAIGAVVLLVFGDDRINDLLRTMRSGTVGTVLQVVIGCCLIGAGVFLWRKPRGQAAAPRAKGPRAGSAAQTLLFGITLTAVGSLSAIPYVGGLSSIAGGGVAILEKVALLVVYNLIYVAPMVVLVLVWRRSGDKSIVAIGRARSRVSRVFADRRWALVLALAGVGLLAWSATV